MRKFISLLFIFAFITSLFLISVSAVEMADGTYEVNIAFWHSEDDKESMAADAIGTKATIVVENGVKTMHITSGEMSMMGIKASLQELKVADKNGNYADAKVESKNSEGNPTGFYFTMPHTNEYITVKVNPHLAIMGNKDIGARIKVDYSSLKLIKAAQAVTASQTETTVEASAAVTEENTVVSTTEMTEATVAQEQQSTTQAVVQPQPDSEEKSSAPVYAVVAIAAVAVIAVIIRKKHKK